MLASAVPMVMLTAGPRDFSREVISNRFTIQYTIKFAHAHSAEGDCSICSQIYDIHVERKGGWTDLIDFYQTGILFWTLHNNGYLSSG